VVTALGPLTPGISYSSRGLGSADPVAPNTKPDGTDNPAGRALNRRVTIAFAATPIRPTPPTPPSAAPGAAAQTGSIAFHGFNFGDATYRASDPALYREGNLLVLTATVTCVAARSANACDPTFDLSGLATVPPAYLATSSSTSFDPPATHSISGFYLLDPASGAEYIPVRGTDGGPVTASFSQSIAAGAAYKVWAYFAAPPSTTTTLTLVSPGGGARLGPIPISAGPPATP
jgi:hypothetical protein